MRNRLSARLSRVAVLLALVLPVIAAGCEDTHPRLHAGVLRRLQRHPARPQPLVHALHLRRRARAPGARSRLLAQRRRHPRLPQRRAAALRRHQPAGPAHARRVRRRAVAAGHPHPHRRRLRHLRVGHDPLQADLPADGHAVVLHHRPGAAARRGRHLAGVLAQLGPPRRRHHHLAARDRHLRGRPQRPGRPRRHAAPGRASSAAPRRPAGTGSTPSPHRSSTGPGTTSTPRTTSRCGPAGSRSRSSGPPTTSATSSPATRPRARTTAGSRTAASRRRRRTSCSTWRSAETGPVATASTPPGSPPRCPSTSCASTRRGDVTELVVAKMG